MNYLLDTNVISEVRKQRPDAGVRRWFAAADDSEIYLSVLVLGQIRQGVGRRRRRDPSAADDLEGWLDGLHRSFSDRVLGISAEVADRWGRLNVPDPLPAVDGLLAATALVHDLTLVTRNVADVERTGARLLNPFG